MKLAIGNDHVGYELKLIIKKHLEDLGHQVIDFGSDSSQSCDYPVYGKKVAQAVASGECELGVLVCGTGIGISLAANKVRGIRAAVCSEPYSAQMARRHNNANIIAFGARVVGRDMAEMIGDSFLQAQFEGGRHARRVALLDEIENER